MEKFTVPLQLFRKRSTVSEIAFQVVTSCNMLFSRHRNGRQPRMCIVFYLVISVVIMKEAKQNVYVVPCRLSKRFRVHAFFCTNSEITNTNVRRLG